MSQEESNIRSTVEPLLGAAYGPVRPSFTDVRHALSLLGYGIRDRTRHAIRASYSDVTGSEELVAGAANAALIVDALGLERGTRVAVIGSVPKTVLDLVEGAVSGDESNQVLFIRAPVPLPKEVEALIAGTDADLSFLVEILNKQPIDVALRIEAFGLTWTVIARSIHGSVVGAVMDVELTSVASLPAPTSDLTSLEGLEVFSGMDVRRLLSAVIFAAQTLEDPGVFVVGDRRTTTGIGLQTGSDWAVFLRGKFPAILGTSRLTKVMEEALGDWAAVGLPGLEQWEVSLETGAGSGASRPLFRLAPSGNRFFLG
jgi:hypothetical protein